MGRQLPKHFGKYANRSFIAETRDGLPWWRCCVASAIVDLARVDGFVTAFAGITDVLRDGQDPRWVVGGDGVRAAFDVVIEWLDAGIDPQDVGLWLRAGCWSAEVAAELAGSCVQPRMLLNEEGRPAQWVRVADGSSQPVCVAVVEWDLTIPDVVRIVAGMAPHEVR